jgi:hypothetical protein
MHGLEIKDLDVTDKIKPQMHEGLLHAKARMMHKAREGLSTFATFAHSWRSLRFIPGQELHPKPCFLTFPKTKGTKAKRIVEIS